MLSLYRRAGDSGGGGVGGWQPASTRLAASGQSSAALPLACPLSMPHGPRASVLPHGPICPNRRLIVSRLPRLHPRDKQPLKAWLTAPQAAAALRGAEDAAGVLNDARLGLMWSDPTGCGRRAGGRPRAREGAFVAPLGEARPHACAPCGTDRGPLTPRHPPSLLPSASPLSRLPPPFQPPSQPPRTFFKSDRADVTLNSWASWVVNQLAAPAADPVRPACALQPASCGQDGPWAGGPSTFCPPLRPPQCPRLKTSPAPRRHTSHQPCPPTPTPLTPSDLCCALEGARRRVLGLARRRGPPARGGRGARARGAARGPALLRP
jgi:hypothetical protein